MMGELNSHEIETLLTKSLIGRIGCNDGQFTYVVPISYAYDGKYIYCHTYEGMKIDILRKNPMTCFEIDDISDMANWQTVIAHGLFEELTDPRLRHEALQRLHNRRLPIVTSQTTKLSEEWPFAPANLDQVTGVTFRIFLTDKSGRFETTRQEMKSFY